MVSMLGSALLGLARAGTTADVAAADIARGAGGAGGAPDVAADFVTLSVAGASVAIDAKVAKAAESDDEALLDVVA
jgi:hypothetical protein